MDRVPTEQDWGNYQDDLDQEYSHRMFAGRTNAEMQTHFRDNVLEGTSDLRWMPKVPFQYYMLGFRDFINSENIDPLEVSDAASCFIRLVLEKLEGDSDCILPIMSELLPTVEYVANNQIKFDADESIYGSFLDLFEQIKAVYGARCNPKDVGE